MERRGTEPRDRLRRVLRVAYAVPDAVPADRPDHTAGPEEGWPDGLADPWAEDPAATGGGAAEPPRSDEAAAPRPSDDASTARRSAEASTPRRHASGTRRRWAMPASMAARVGIAVVVLAGIALAIVWPRGEPEQAPQPPLATPGAPVVTAPADPAGSPGPASSTSPTPSEQPTELNVAVVVHVAGAVLIPGVYELPAGSRVDDAVLAAGGPTAAADLDAVNLAGWLQDGQQVYVPAVGEAAPPAAAPGAPSGTDAGGDDGGPVDLNAATAADLEELPGIGPALAQRILDWRTENGGFTSVDQLDDVSGIGPATMDRLRDLVTV